MISRAARLAAACETMESAAWELLAAAEVFATPCADRHELARRRRVLFIAARSYTRAVDAVRRRRDPP